MTRWKLQRANFFKFSCWYFIPVRFVVFPRYEQEEINIGFLKPTSFDRLFNSNKMMNLENSDQAGPRVFKGGGRLNGFQI